MLVLPLYFWAILALKNLVRENFSLATVGFTPILTFNAVFVESMDFLDVVDWRFMFALAIPAFANDFHAFNYIAKECCALLKLRQQSRAPL